MSEEADLLGDQPLSEMEGKVLAVYEGLKNLLTRDDCPPVVIFSAREALAAIYPAVNALGIKYEYLFDLEV